MKKNIICTIAVDSIFSAVSVNSLNEKSEWKTYSESNTADTTHITSANLIERPKWGKYFSDSQVTGTIYIVDEREGGNFVYNRDRAVRRFTPASTFKIPHALFALDAGIVKDEFQVFPWDGVERSVGIEKYDAVWNSNQTLPLSLRYSVVWLYQQFAKELGSEKEIDYLSRLGYGNATVGKDVEQFWLDGSLKISALEQVAFLQKLYRNQLPFAVEHQRLVKDLMITEAGSDYKIRSKTGWGTPEDKDVLYFLQLISICQTVKQI